MRWLVAGVLFVGVPAAAHIKLSSPTNVMVTDVYGSPNKAEPCGGAGTPSNVVTTVTAGTQLTVRWTEPIYHPGHFRLALAANSADFVTPTPVVETNDCKSAPIQSSPTAPVLVDGLYPAHSSTETTHEYTITVPSTPCANCTLQLMQFMSSHAPPCFYYQCAALKIVAPDAGAGGGAGGGGGAANGGGGAATGGGGAANGGGSTNGGAAATGGGATTGAGAATGGAVDGGALVVGDSLPGCSCSAGGGAGLVLTFVGLARWRRRRR